MGLATKTIKNSIYSFLGFVWPLILFFFSIPYFIHKLGMEGYGIWVLINSIIGTLGILNFGIGDALIKYVSEYHSKADTKTVNKVVGNSFLIYSFISAIILVVGIFGFQFFLSFFNIKENYKELVGFVFRVATLGFVINLFTYNALSILKGLQRYDISSKITIFSDSVKILGMVLMLYLGFGLKGMVIAYVAGTLFGFLLILFLLKKYLPEVQLKPFYEKATLKMIFSFSFYSFFTGLSGVLRANVGNILIGKYLGASIVPFFSVPSQISSQIHSAVASTTTVLFPVFSSLKASNDVASIKRIFIKASKFGVFLGFGISITAIVLSFPILSIWLGKDFALISHDVFSLLLISLMFTLANTVSYFALNGFGFIKTTCMYQSLSAVMIFFLCLFLIPSQGIIGSAYAYFVGNVLLVIFVFLATKKIWKREWLRETAKIYTPTVLSVFIVFLVFTFAINPRIENFQTLWLWGTATFILYSTITALIDLKFFKEQFILVKGIAKEKLSWI